MRLSVGYDGEENLQHLFSGDLRIADTDHSGANVETTLEMGEGDRAFQFAHVSRSYSGVPQIKVVSDAITSLGLPVPESLKAITALSLPFTGVVHGPAHAEVTNLLTPAGVGWSIQDGQFVALAAAQVREGEAVLIRQGDGMVGSPKIGASKKPGEAPMLHVKTLIDPRISAGGKIQVRSRDINGVFRVEHLEHSGDFRGKDWYTEVRARPV